MIFTNPPDNAMDDAARFINMFHLAALQAGALARRLQDEVRSRTKAGESTPESAALTSVDLAAQDVILLLLHQAFPGVGMDAEEKTETIGLFPGADAPYPVIVVDPVDGTLNYSEGLQDYAVMGAWLEKGRYESALIHFPHWGETYWARRSTGCRFLGPTGEMKEVTVSAPLDRVLVSANVPEAWLEALWKNGFDVIVSRCSAVDGIAPVMGRAAASLTQSSPDRRRSIGHLLTLEAGGVVWNGDRWWDGEDPVTIPEHRGYTVVAQNEELVQRVLDAVM